MVSPRFRELLFKPRPNLRLPSPVMGGDEATDDGCVAINALLLLADCVMLLTSCPKIDSMAVSYTMQHVELSRDTAPLYGPFTEIG